MGIILKYCFEGLNHQVIPCALLFYALIWQGSTWRPRKTPGGQLSVAPFFSTGRYNISHHIPSQMKDTCVDDVDHVDVRQCIWICNLPISMPHLGRLDCFWIGQSTVSPLPSKWFTTILSSRWIRHRCKLQNQEGQWVSNDTYYLYRYGASVQATVQLCDMLDDNVAYAVNTYQTFDTFVLKEWRIAQLAARDRALISVPS